MVIIVVDKSDEDEVMDKATNLDFINREYRGAKVLIRFHDTDIDDLERLGANLDNSNIDHQIIEE